MCWQPLIPKETDRVVTAPSPQRTDRSVGPLSYGRTQSSTSGRGGRLPVKPTTTVKNTKMDDGTLYSRGLCSVISDPSKLRSNRRTPPPTEPTPSSDTAEKVSFSGPKFHVFSTKHVENVRSCDVGLSLVRAGPDGSTSMELFGFGIVGGKQFI